MRMMTATEASRKFSDLLDAIERGETIRITRNGGEVAEMGPVKRSTWAGLRLALDEVPPLDDRFEEDINAALALLEPWDPDELCPAD